MDQNHRAVASAAAPRAYQFHPTRTAIIDLFNLYLGRNSTRKTDDSVRETPNKLQKRVTAFNRDLPPPNEQFLIDFEQLQTQFQDQEQLRVVTESVLIGLVVQCSSHAPRAEFVLFALRSLCRIGYINWDSFLPSLLSSVSSAEVSFAHGSSQVSQSGVIPSSSTVHNPGVGSPAQISTDSLSCKTLSPDHLVLRDYSVSCLRQLSCKIILSGLESNLKPVTHADIFSNMLNWLVNWDQRQQGVVESAAKTWKPDTVLNEWLHSCLDVIWLLVDEDKCRVPFYELLRSGLQFIENIPDDEALFTIILEIHRRRDMVAAHMQMLDHHLHCPTFGTHRFLSQAYPSISGEASSNTRYSPITYPSVLGEPLHGEDLATSIQRGSLDWERALRCLRHALVATPSPDWWRRVLIIAPCYRPHAQQVPTPGAVFSSEMICEAAIDRTIELLKMTNTETHCWQEWLIFSDIFFFLMKSGCIDFLDFVDKLASRVIEGDPQLLQSNHVTWLLAQIIRIEIVTSALNTDPKKIETTRKILLFHKEDKNSDSINVSPGSILLDFISSSQTLRIWSFNSSLKEYLNHEQLQKGKQIDEWWKQVTKGERMMDFMNLDDRSIGMFWVLSHTMAQPACEAVMNWLTSSGITELPASNIQSSERVVVMRECYPLPMSLLSGLSINLCLKLAFQMEESLFLGQAIPSIAMVETYTRLLLIQPHSLFRSHFSTLTQRSPSILSKSGVSLLLLEILNYRLLPLYRYHGKSKNLLSDVTKLISMMKGKRGEHRVFRLAENLCMNIMLSLRDFFVVKKELKGPTDFTETLNRIAIISLAITIKTRGIGEVEHMLYFLPLLEQIMSTCQHTWSEKTLRHFPTLIRDALIGRVDKRGHSIQAWKQVETTVINQCTQLLSPSADPGYVVTYINHSFPQHRQYLCAGAWMLMHGHPDSINSANLGRVLRELSPDEVTSNIYTMVDVLLHQIHTELQHGHPLQVYTYAYYDSDGWKMEVKVGNAWEIHGEMDVGPFGRSFLRGGYRTVDLPAVNPDLLVKASAGIAFFIWTHELLPLDILLLAITDRDDDPHALRIVMNLLERGELQQRIKLFCLNRGHHEHWLQGGIFKRTELQKALGNHLSWKERYPPFFDDIAARLLPVIPLIIYRLVENDAADLADRVLSTFTPFLAYHPTRFTFVRDILAYFYGHLPSQLIVRILNVLDLSKIPFSESFPQQIGSTNSAICPPQDYFATLLFGIVINVIPPLNSKAKSLSTGDTSKHFVKTPPSSLSGQTNVSDSHKAFYQNQDPGTYTQLVLETAVIEILSLPVSPSQIVSSLVQIVVHVQQTLIQSNNGMQGAPSGVGQSSSALATSPSGGSTDSLGTSRSTPSGSGINAANFVSRSGYTCQQLSCLFIQACGLLFAQLPPDFHMQLYLEASRIIKESWWLTDGRKSLKELDSAVGYALLDPTSAAQDYTSTAIVTDLPVAVGRTIGLRRLAGTVVGLRWLPGTDPAGSGGLGLACRVWFGSAGPDLVVSTDPAVRAWFRSVGPVWWAPC
ncbi:hypothetical protein GIB67_020980 [Kingdonia uniflora]|uniref:Mediator of RNA polymerase II transcription subunit 23 n=1 Tax=Kingdonia uniflora TaxID=39325 RepID=A0A7J7M7N0_9MAGN|nr:hypothetical protein GIB67_020980 [Kingdonia uniflora]